MRRLPFALGFAIALLLASPPPVTASKSCRPRSATDWAESCATREGRRDLRERLPGATARFDALDDVEDVTDACTLLATPVGNACRKARRQLLATALNLESGRLTRGCCVTWNERDVRVGDVLRRHADDCARGTDCDRARRFLRLVNTSAHRCESNDDDDACCQPRSKGFWHRQCLGIGAIDPGRGRGPGLHPAFTEDRLRRILRRANRRLEDFDVTVCEALDQHRDRSARGRALAQLAALAANLEAGFLDDCGRDRLERRFERIGDLIADGDFETAKSRAERINTGQSVRRCDDAGEPDPPKSARSKKHPKSKHHGHGHGHGKKGKGKKKWRW